MKKAAIIVGILLALVIALFLVRNVVARTALAKAVTKITGLDFTTESVNIGVFNTSITMKGLRLHNPSGFPDPVMVDIARIYVDYDLGDCIRKKVHLEELALALDELVVVKNKEGELNLNALKVVKEEKEKEEDKGKETPAEGEQGKAPEIQIDVLELKIGKVVYKDYSRGESPKVQEFNVNIDERYENITDLQKLGRLVVVKALRETAIARLAGFDMRLLEGGLDDVLGAAAAGAVEDAVGKAVGIDKGVAREATKALKKVLGK